MDSVWSEVEKAGLSSTGDQSDREASSEVSEDKGTETQEQEVRDRPLLSSDPVPCELDPQKFVCVSVCVCVFVWCVCMHACVCVLCVCVCVCLLVIVCCACV